MEAAKYLKLTAATPTQAQQQDITAGCHLGIHPISPTLG